jgi:hypothetical protein
MLEVPQGHQLVSKKSSLAFWRKPEFVIRGEGKYTASKKEVEAIEAGEIFCVSQDFKVDFEADVEITSFSDALKSKLGMGQRSFATVSGSFSAQFDRGMLSDAITSDAKESIVGKVKESLEETLKRDKKTLRLEAREALELDLSKGLQEKLGNSKVQVTVDSIEYPEPADAFVSGVSVSLREGDFVAPKLSSEVPVEGYFAVGGVLVLTLLGYGFVRLFFGEVIGLFVALIASAFGYSVAHQPGYYNSGRPRRRTGAALPDVGPIVDVAGELVQAGAHRMDASEITDGISSAVDAAGSIGDAVGGIGDTVDGIGTVFDIFGALSDIF